MDSSDAASAEQHSDSEAEVIAIIENNPEISNAGPARRNIRRNAFISDSPPVIASPVLHEPPQRRSSTNSAYEESDEEQFFDLADTDATSPDEDYSQEHDYSPSTKETKPDWSLRPKKKNIKTFEYTGEAGLTNLDLNRRYTPLECFKLFVDDEMINMMVEETNKNAHLQFIRPSYHEGFLSGWMDVTFKEMTQFIGVLIFMTYKCLTDTSYYWSTERIYSNAFIYRVMTQTRFHRILKFWHFGRDGTDSKYSKLNPVLDRLNRNFTKYKQPADTLVVTRSSVFLRNRYSTYYAAFRKGSKILNLLDNDVYTYKLHVLQPDCNKDTKRIIKPILNLVEDFLDQGRLIVLHNLNSSVELAQEFLKRKTHCVGTIRKKSRGTPQEVWTRDIERGDMIGYQNGDGIAVIKWTISSSAYVGIKYAYGITTCHTMKENVAFPGRPSSKPDTSGYSRDETEFLRDFKASERVFDAHERFANHKSPINDKMKWYKTMGADFITNTAVINALVIYKKINRQKITLYHFRDKLFRELVGVGQLPPVSSECECLEPEPDLDSSLDNSM